MVDRVNLRVKDCFVAGTLLEQPYAELHRLTLVLLGRIVASGEVFFDDNR